MFYRLEIKINWVPPANDTHWQGQYIYCESAYGHNDSITKAFELGVEIDGRVNSKFG